MTILAEIVRRLDGRRFETYVRDEVFAPLGMNDCWVGMPADVVEGYGDRIGTMHSTATGTAIPLDTLRHARLPSAGACPAAAGAVRCASSAGCTRRCSGAASSTAAVSSRRRRSRRSPRATASASTTRRSTRGCDWGLGFAVDAYAMGRHASPRAFGHGGALSAISFADPEHGLVAVRADQRHVRQRRPLPPPRRGHHRALRGSRPGRARRARSRQAVPVGRAHRSDRLTRGVIPPWPTTGRRRRSTTCRRATSCATRARSSPWRASTRRSSAATRWCASSRTRPTVGTRTPRSAAATSRCRSPRRMTDERRTARHTCASSTSRRLQPGAYCTGVLADLGADVLRVEPPARGDPLRMIPGATEAYHRGKRAMTLDLKHDDAPEILRRLIAEVDVVVESGLPAALAAQGIDYGTLAADQPGLVWCTISGFGEGSPYAKRPAHDITFLGYSGLMALMAGDTVPPTPDFVLAVPFGSLIAVVGILAALTERDRTGEGRFVDTSIVDSRHLGAGRSGGARRRRAARRDGAQRPTGAPTAPPTASSSPSPPPSRARGRRSARRSTGPISPTRLANPPGGQAALAEELAALFATPPGGRVGRAARRRRRRRRPGPQRRGPARRPARAARGSVVELDDDAAHARAAHAGAAPRRTTAPSEPVAPGPPPALGEHTDDRAGRRRLHRRRDRRVPRPTARSEPAPTQEGATMTVRDRPRPATARW